MTDNTEAQIFNALNDDDQFGDAVDRGSLAEAADRAAQIAGELAASEQQEKG